MRTRTPDTPRDLVNSFVTNVIHRRDRVKIMPCVEEEERRKKKKSKRGKREVKRDREKEGNTKIERKREGGGRRER